MTDTTTDVHDLLGVLDRALSLAESVIARIADDQRELVTCCPEFSVDVLAAHLTSSLHWYAQIPQIGVVAPGDITDPDLVGQPLLEAFEAECSLTRTAWSAAALATTYQTPFGPMSGRQLTTFTIIEVLGHALDLAWATGQEIQPDDDLLEAGLLVASGVGEDLRGPEMMGPEVPVPEDASLADRFMGFLGRDPAWRVGRGRPATR